MKRRKSRLKAFLAATVVGIAVLLAGLYLLGYLSGEPELGGEAPTGSPGPKAIIYDPLYREYPNDGLVQDLRRMLENHGYTVDVVLGRNATLNWFSYMRYYDIVIIRAHGGISNESVGPYPPGEYIYTGLHVDEAVSIYGRGVYNWIRSGLLAEGVIPPPGGATREELERLPRYIVASPKFIEKYGAFKNGSAVFFFGCYGLTTGDLADTVLSKGAKIFVAWRGGVTVSHMDNVLPGVLEAYLNGGVDGLLEAVASTEPDPSTGAELVVKARS